MGGEEHRLELLYEVSGRRPASIELTQHPECRDAPMPAVAVSASGFRRLGVSLVDGDGEVFGAHNVWDTHPISLRERAPEGTILEDEERGIRGLRFGTTSGVLEISAEVGEPLTLDVLDLGAITGWSPEFQVAAVAGTPLTVESDQEYSLRGRSSNRIVPVAKGYPPGDDVLCTDYDPSWFEFESLTPDVCVIDEAPLEFPPDVFVHLGHLRQAHR